MSLPDSHCFKCLLEIFERAIKLSTNDQHKQKELLLQVKTRLEKEFASLSLPEFSTTILKEISKKTNTIDPFKPIKNRSNRFFLNLLPELLENIKQYPDKKNQLRYLFLLSIGANMVDFSTGGHEVNFDELDQELKTFHKQGLQIDDFDVFYQNFLKSEKIIYLADNCGEVVIDNIIVNFLMEYYSKKIFFGLKSAPIANDCTIDDFREAKLKSKATRVFVINSAFGWNLHESISDFRDLLQKCDLLIVKGQANFETTLNNLVRYPTKNFPLIYNVLRTKCKVITKRLGVPLGSNIFKQMHPLPKNKQSWLREIVEE
jgi:hypothetical protein